MKIGIIVPYFGKLPNYIQLFLNSCEINSDYEWFILTNDNTNYSYPNNVHKISMTFEECKNIIISKFNFMINLSSPQKLCDFKCAYGYIFSDLLKDFDWWGHCDLDQIFGNLNNFISEDMLNKFDKLFSLGHLTLYKNTAENNIVFMNNINNSKRYKEVFSTEKGCAFDEWLPGNINEIYLETGKPVMLENMCADINSYKTDFTLVYFDLNKKKYFSDGIRNSIFQWKNGQLYRIYNDSKGKIITTEFPYVHLQKRKMKDLLVDNSDYYIIPNKFINSEKTLYQLLNNCLKYKYINYQFFIVKFKSLKSRIKTKNWEFINIFK